MKRTRSAFVVTEKTEQMEDGEKAHMRVYLSRNSAENYRDQLRSSGVKTSILEVPLHVPG